jgi:hypothetical protein
MSGPTLRLSVRLRQASLPAVAERALDVPRMMLHFMSVASDGVISRQRLEGRMLDAGSQGCCTGGLDPLANSQVSACTPTTGESCS